MKNIKELLEQYCPNGVEYRNLGDLCDFQRGKSITQKDVRSGGIPVIAGGRKPAYYHDTFNRGAGTIAVAGSGAYAGFLSYWDCPVFLSDSFSISPKSDNLLSKYIFYFLSNMQSYIYSLQRGVAVAHVYGHDLATIQVAVPPLPVQEGIVIFLDKFSGLQSRLESNLAAELGVRRQQYAYYREFLLDFSSENLVYHPLYKSLGKYLALSSEEQMRHDCRDRVEHLPMGEVGRFLRGNGLQKKDFSETGFPCIHYGQIYSHYGSYAEQAKTFVSPELAQKLRQASTGDLIIATTGENAADVCKAVAWLGKEKLAVSGDAMIYQHSLQAKYAAYFFQTEQFHAQKKTYVTGAQIKRVSADNLSKCKIPVPPVEIQEQIADILDKLERVVLALCRELPSEIASRHRQYLYCREQVLNFPELE